VEVLRWSGWWGLAGGAFMVVQGLDVREAEVVSWILRSTLGGYGVRLPSEAFGND
jgi:hypothetical protein